MYLVPLVGGVSRPSAKKWTKVCGTSAFLAALSSASRCSMCECTPPSLTSPSRWNLPPPVLAFASAACSRSLV